MLHRRKALSISSLYAPVSRSTASQCWRRSRSWWAALHKPSGLFGANVPARSRWWAMDGAITRTKYMNWSRTTCRRHGTPGPPSASPTEPRHSRSRLGLFGWPGVCLRASLEKCEVDWNQVGRKRGFCGGCAVCQTGHPHGTILRWTPRMVSQRNASGIVIAPQDSTGIAPDLVNGAVRRR